LTTKTKAWTIGNGQAFFKKKFNMLIGELAQKSGLTKDTIRFYEKKGLINLNTDDRRDNNYKEYPDQVLNKLLLVQKLKDMGFTLNSLLMRLILFWNCGRKKTRHV
jgi:hypothetical protein